VSCPHDPEAMKNGSCPATSLSGRATSPLVIPTGAQRSGGTCGSGAPFLEVFFDRGIRAFGPPKVTKSSPRSATTLPGCTALPFVISTEAKRSGEICVQRLLLGNALFLQLLSLGAPLSPLSSRPERSVVERSLCGCSVLGMFFDRARTGETCGFFPGSHSI
jgi:hypothetical protein